LPAVVVAEFKLGTALLAGAVIAGWKYILQLEIRVSGVKCTVASFISTRYYRIY
jgi:hypothetical protein